MPTRFPEIPDEIVKRFATAREWQKKLEEFWTQTTHAIQEAQTQAANFSNSRVIFSVDSFLIYAKGGIPQPMFALDSTGVKLGNVLTISTPGRKIFIGEGVFNSANTPFYVDALGNFSLGDSLVWDADTDSLTIVGSITATSGTIGGFTISPTTFTAGAGATSFSMSSATGAMVLGTPGTTRGDLSSSGIGFLTSASSSGMDADNISIVTAGTGATSNQTANGLMMSATSGAFSNLNLTSLGFKAFTGQPTISLGTGSTVQSMNLAATSGIAILEFQSDTNLYRSAANTLKTDDAFIITGTLGVSDAVTVTTTNPFLLTDNASYLTWQGVVASNRGFYMQREGTDIGVHLLSAGHNASFRTEIYGGTFAAKTACSAGVLTSLSFNFATHNTGTWQFSGVDINVNADEALSSTAKGSSMEILSHANGNTNSGYIRIKSNEIAFRPSFFGTYDTNLYRSAADTLKTDDTFICAILQLGNAAVAATPVPTHTVTIKDSTGTTYRVPCVV